MSSTNNGNGATVRLTIPARAEYITLCRLALTGIARVRDFSDEVLADLKLALTEAASNSVRHAYAGDDHAGVVEISSSFDITCALRIDSSLWCWGGSIYDLPNGLLGDVDRSDSPIEIDWKTGLAAAECE